jgi:hypothetical protein
MSARIPADISTDIIQLQQTFPSLSHQSINSTAIMHFQTVALTLAAVASVVEAGVLPRAAACSSYTIIDTRGTGELQGPSSGFRTMNSNIMRQVPGGKEYDTVYAADFSQVSTLGTNDIVRKVKSTLATNPNECFLLEGYSQGAAATVNALSQLTGTAFDAVKGVFLIGDPEHRAGLACNTDTNGGDTTNNVNGLSAALGGIPANWVSKTLDVCNFVSRHGTNIAQKNRHLTFRPQGDGVCDTTHGFGINAQHLAYPTSASTQQLGTNFGVKALQG